MHVTRAAERNELLMTIVIDLFLHTSLFGDVDVPLHCKICKMLEVRIIYALQFCNRLF